MSIKSFVGLNGVIKVMLVISYSLSVTIFQYLILYSADCHQLGIPFEGAHARVKRDEHCNLNPKAVLGQICEP